MSGKHRATDYKGRRRPLKETSRPSRSLWAVPALLGIALAGVLSHKTEAKPKPEMPEANTCSILSVQDVLPHEKGSDGKELDRVDAWIRLNGEVTTTLGNQAIKVTLKHPGEKPSETKASLYVNEEVRTASFYTPLNERDGTVATISIRPEGGGVIACDSNLVREGGEWHKMAPGDMPLRSAQQEPTRPRRS